MYYLSRNFMFFTIGLLCFGSQFSVIKGQEIRSIEKRAKSEQKPKPEEIPFPVITDFPAASVFRGAVEEWFDKVDESALHKLMTSGHGRGTVYYSMWKNWLRSKTHERMVATRWGGKTPETPEENQTFVYRDRGEWIEWSEEHQLWFRCILIEKGQKLRTRWKNGEWRIVSDPLPSNREYQEHVWCYCNGKWYLSKG